MKPTRGLAMKPHEAHAKTDHEPSEAQSMTSTTRGARPGCGNRGPVLARIRFGHHQHPESRSFVGMATDPNCIDAKACCLFTVSFKCFVVIAAGETIGWGPWWHVKGPCEPCFLKMAPDGPSQRTDKVGSLGVSCVHVPEKGCPEDNSASFTELPATLL